MDTHTVYELNSKLFCIDIQYLISILTFTKALFTFFKNVEKIPKGKNHIYHNEVFLTPLWYIYDFFPCW